MKARAAAKLVRSPGTLFRHTVVRPKKGSGAFRRKARSAKREAV